FRITDVVSSIGAYGNTSLVSDVVLDAKSNIKVALMLFWVLTGLNVIACGWIMISETKLIGEPLTDYIYGLYWAITTLTTVGYGDITPDSNIGRLYTILIMLVGVGMYGLVIGNISSVMSQSKATETSQREKVVNLAKFLQQYQIPKDLQRDIFSFYQHYLFEKEVQLSGVVDDLPFELQKNTTIYVKVYMLRNVPIFSHVSQEHLVEIAQLLASRIVSPGEIIIKAGEVGEEMYFLSHGTVEVLTADGQSIAKLRTGSFFGELALLEHGKRMATVRANTYCDLYILGKKDFTHVVATNPEFKKQLDAIVQERKRG
ncbi:MAG: cyclic nucleotide-binding domain-containing protein, partial [Magnetococcales bacterium]|nr:cyclic nucleotide-binding domain-containing protein [Magnetococcales bacterium]